MSIRHARVQATPTAHEHQPKHCRRAETSTRAVPERLKRKPIARILQLSLRASATGVLLAGSSAGWAQTSGTPCVATSGYVCFIAANGTNGTPAPSTSFDKSGHPGGNATSGSAVSTQLFGSNAFPASPYISYGTTPAISSQSVGGNGASGGNASNGDAAPVQDLSAGNGGTAGNGASVTLTIPQGSEVQAYGAATAGGSGLTNQPAAIQVISQGGNGGGGGVPSEGGIEGTSQTGGAAGNVTLSNFADPGQPDTLYNSGMNGAVFGYSTGMLAESVGGNGGSGNNHVTGYAKAGVDGGDSMSPGGTVTVTTNTSIVAFSSFGQGGAASGDQGAGIWAVSAGGNGGSGGTGSDATVGGSGGQGGAAADGGTVTVTVQQGGSVSTQAGVSGTPAIWAQSLGGIGGAGGNGGDWASGGNSGAGGNGNTVTVTNDGALSTAGAPHSPGILAQSFGGAGPNGGKGGGWGASGGEGASGGNGGQVLVYGTGSIQTSSTDSPGILAQSVGGGGGNGGDSTGWMAVGGSGNFAGSGNTVLVNTTQNITTSGNASTGIMAQSIGGGGGNGGNATDKLGSEVNLVIGGDGGAGGNGSNVQAYSGGNIVTTGQHSSGMELQSIGGGGGKGGSAFANDVNGVFGAQESIGGNGGAGGAAAWIGFASGSQPVTNAGSIRTSGSDSFGIIAQSIGGGGGIGAASVAQSKTYAPDDTPSLSLTAAIGGTGGSGGDGSTAQITNGGIIATSGAGSIGMIAQSIGGGGGSGGDSSASSSANGSEFNIAASVSIGGKGGGAGDGNAINASNTGLVVTTGESADGILAQSIGGGGGNGGSGDAQASTTGDGTGISASIPIGGKSGGGGNAYQLVQANNLGAILTLGDGATGIVAQAVGGGGGRAGGAAGTSKGDFSATVSVGGSGGNGGSALNPASTAQNPLISVAATNSGSIVTFGADASGIVAQSIGGGGGMGGKAATSIGSKKSTGDGGNGTSTSNSTLDSLAAAFQAGGQTSQYTSLGALTTLANTLLGNTTPSARSAQLKSRLGDAANDASNLDDMADSQGDAGDDSNSTSIKANVAVGGTGGSGGSGGNVQVTNSGSIGTTGSMSDGILAQSIGGGGGKGGAATSSGSASVDADDVSAPVAVGGRGGIAGRGSDVSVTNGAGATLITIGALANGIVAQSIGGGGGMGGVAGGRGGALQGLNVSNRGINIGGDDIGSSKDASTVSAGTVTVDNDAGATILTESHDASGIVAQSIGAGGGLVKAISTDASDNSGGGANPNPSSEPEINIVFGGTSGNGSNGSGGAVNVTNSGAITTQGRNAYGVLAQSIGGGGGLVLGGEIAGGPGGFFNIAAMRGNGNTVTVNTDSGSSIATSGAGAVGIFAQSIGGGGGLAGDTGLSQLHLSYPGANNHPGDGTGGTVNVTVGANSSVNTTGPNAPAIIAQSVGGGGGYFTAGASGYAQGLYAGSFGGSGNAGAVNVTVSGTVGATGPASPAIYAQSSQNGGRSTTGQPVIVNVNQGATVSGGTDFYHGGDGTAAGIQVFDGYYNAAGPANVPANIVNVNGTVTSVDGVNGSGVFSYGGTTFVHNGPTGVIDGTISVQNNGGNGSVQNDPGGKLNTGATVAAMLTQNDGTLDVGGAAAPGAATLVTGDLKQGSTGNIVIDSDHVTAVSDRLTVAGNATLAGQIVMRPTRLSNSTVDVMDVAGKLDATQLSVRNPYLVSYSLSSGNTQTMQNVPGTGQSLYVTPHANFAANAAGLSANAQSVASHLQANFDSGASANALGTAFAQLANGVQSRASYAAALNSLGNETQQAVGTAYLAASHAFVERMYSCPTFDGAADTMMHERDCVWGRVIDNHTSASGADSLGYSANTYAMQFGGQHRIGDGWFLGGSVGYGTTSLDGSDGVGDVNGHGPQAGITLKKEIGQWTISGGADTAYGWYDSTRNIALPDSTAQAKGDFDSYEAGLHARVAFTAPMTDWYMKPYVDVHFVHVHTGGYTEQGAGALDLDVSSASATTLSVSPMFEVGGRLSFVNGMVLRPDVAVGGVFHNHDHWDANAQFVGSAQGVAPFTAVSSAPSELAKVKLDMNLSVTKSTEIKLEYGGQFGSGYSSNEGMLRVNHLF